VAGIQLIDPIQAYSIFVATCFGLVIGSFLNVVIYRLPEGLSVVHPPSRCPHCGHGVRAFDNVPVFAWFWLRGKCRDCGSPISARYPGIEALTGLMFGLITWTFGVSPLSVIYMVFAAALIAASMIDFDHQIIPDEISLGGLVIAMVAVPSARAWMGIESFADAAIYSVSGALIGAGGLWIVAFVHARVSVAMGREFEHWPGEGESLPTPGQADYWLWFPGLGLGDVKLLAMIGAVLGPLGVLDTIVTASAVGLAMGVGWALVKGNWESPFGFGPALGFGALLAVLLPEHLVVLLAQWQGT
jgi:leader peptidase (prepilin peptidase)/N-methyltransferase